MASKDQILPFEKEGQVGESIPYHENIGPTAIQLWTPKPDRTKDYLLKMEAVEDSKNPGTWYGMYTKIGAEWKKDSKMERFFKEIALDYEPNGQYLITKNIPAGIFPTDGWAIVEFGLARFVSGNLISRVRWEHGSTGEKWVTAYSWPGC